MGGLSFALSSLHSENMEKSSLFPILESEINRQFIIVHIALPSRLLILNEGLYSAFLSPPKEYTRDNDQQYPAQYHADKQPVLE